MRNPADGVCQTKDERVTSGQRSRDESAEFARRSLVADPTKLRGAATFDVPVRFVSHGADNLLGVPQQDSYYAVQYTFGGGKVTINAGAGNLNVSHSPDARLAKAIRALSSETRMVTDDAQRRQRQ